MADGPSPKQTFDREEVALILHEAAQLDVPRIVPRPAEPAVESAGDGMTLREIEEAASEVGISRSAVGTASLGVALRGAHAGAPRFHHVHDIAGALSSDDYDALASEVRTLVAPSALTRTAGGLEFVVGKPSGEAGSLLVQIRSRDGATTVSVWSDAPRMSVDELVLSALVGGTAFIFPVVAAAGGSFPAIGAFAALAAVGAGVGTGVGLSARQWLANRWRARITKALVPVVARVAEIAGR